MSKKHEEVAFKITSYFETGGANPYSVISPNFDRQGISWGPHQINLGQGTMQPVLWEIHKKHSKKLDTILKASGDGGSMTKDFLELLGKNKNSEAVAFVDENWHEPGKPKRLKKKWTRVFQALGKLPEVQALIRKQTAWIDYKAEVLSKWIAKGGRRTIRMYCLAYDIVTQNGGVGRGLRAALTAGRPFLRVYRSNLERKGRSVEWAWLNIVAGCRALQTRITGATRFAPDVAARKFLIVDGEGRFRGSWVDLEEKFGLSDEEI